MHHLHLARPSAPAHRTPLFERRGRILGATALAVCATLVPASTGFGQAGPPSDPRGNNGTVKVDGAPFDDHPNNEPHPGCTFQIDFYGYDAGVGDASVSFALQAPTASGRTLSVGGGDLTPNIGQDAAGGGTDLDASETYRLDFTGAPAKQGYHVKLTVHAPGSIGADTKHKVFWVEGCEETAPATTPTTAPTGTPAPGTDVEGAGQEAPPAPRGGTPDAEVRGAELDRSAGAATTATPAAGAEAVPGSPQFTG